MQLAEEEKAGKGIQGDPEPASSIELASEADLERDLALDIGMSLDTIIDTEICSDIMDTVRVCGTGVADSGDCDTIICDPSEQHSESDDALEYLTDPEEHCAMDLEVDSDAVDRGPVAGR
jgi:hypothetical protein